MLKKKSAFYIFIISGFLYNIIFFELVNADEKFAIAIRVNNDVITNFEIEQRKKIYKLLNVQLYNNIKKVKNKLIEEKLKNQHASSLNIFLSKKEIQLEIDKFLKERKATKEFLLKSLKENNISKTAFDTYISQPLLWKKTVLKLFRNKMNVTDNQLKEYVLKNSPPTSSKVDLSEIVIPFSERGKKNSLLLAKRLYIELSAGSDFGIAAKRFSRSKSAIASGKVGIIEEEILPLNVRQIISLMSSQQVSDPIIMGENVVLFKLNKRIETESSKINDPIVTFVEVKSHDLNGVQECGSNNKLLKGPNPVSSLKNKLSKVLKLATIFEPAYVSEGTWIILCSKKLNLDKKLETELKNRYLNEKIKKLSNNLILKLHREATIH